MDNIIRMKLHAWLRDQRVRALRFGPKEPKPLDRRRKLPPQAVPTGPILPQPEMHACVEGFRSAFRRRDTLRNAEIYLLGLCSDLPHKNGETMEAAIPGAKQPTPPPAPYKGRGRPPKARQPQCPLHTVAEIRQAVAPEAWQRVVYRRGQDGAPLEREFVAVRVQPATRDAVGPEAWLLLERPLEPDGGRVGGWRQRLQVGPIRCRPFRLAVPH